MPHPQRQCDLGPGAAAPPGPPGPAGPGLSDLYYVFETGIAPPLSGGTAIAQCDPAAVTGGIAAAAGEFDDDAADRSMPRTWLDLAAGPNGWVEATIGETPESFRNVYVRFSREADGRWSPTGELRVVGLTSAV